MIVDVVDNDDGGCAGIDGGDVAVLAGEGGLVMRAVGSSSVWVAISMVVGPTWVLASLWVGSSASFDAMAFTTSVTSISCPSSTDTQWP